MIDMGINEFLPPYNNQMKVVLLRVDGVAVM